VPVLFNKQAGREEFVPNEAVSDAIASGKFEAPGGANVAVTTPQGRVVQATPEDLAAAGASGGLRPATTGELGTAEERAFLQQEHGGAGGVAGAFVEGAVDAATLGGYGAATKLLGGPDYTDERAARREVHPIAATAGDIAGTVAPALLSGGAGAAGTAARLSPAGLASRAGDLVVKAGRAGGLIEGAAAAGAGYAVEGALYGAGHVLSESVLQDKELSAETFLAGAGQGALWGGLTGAGATLFSRGASAARGKLDSMASSSKELTTLQAEHKIAIKEAQREQRLADRLRIEQERHLNRAGLEELKQRGKLELVEARGATAQEQTAFSAEQKLKLEEYRLGGKKDLAEVGAGARLKIADTRLQAELAKAEAKAAVAKAKVSKVGDALAVEQAKLERARLVMDGRIQLSETYTSGWRKAAESREAVAGSKLEAAGVTADAKIRTGLADALVASKRPDAGYLVEELIPAKLRSARAVEAAKGGVLNHAAEMASATDDLVRQADEIMAANPGAAADLRFMRDRAAKAAPKVSDWAEKQAGAKAFQAENLDDLKAAGFTGPAEPAARAPAVAEDALAAPGFDPSIENQGLKLFDEGASIKQGVPTFRQLSSEDHRAVGYVVRPSELADSSLGGLVPSAETRAERIGSIKQGWDEGADMPPIEIDMGPSGALGVADGNHRLLAAAETDRPVLVRFRAVDESSLNSAPMADEVRSILPKQTVDAENLRGAATDFEDGFQTVRAAEQAHYDLAQAVRPYLDDVSGAALDDAVKGMDEAVGKQDEIVTDVMTRHAESAVGEPGGVRQRGGAGDAVAAADLLAGAAGLPNSEDIPVVGPLLSAYLKFRAASGALGKLGIRLPGSVARIAHLGASAQDGAATAVRVLVRGADKAAPVVTRSSAALSSVLSRPLWDPIDEAKPARKPSGEPAPKGKPDPLKLFRDRAEELERVSSNPEEVRRQILESIPAPPALAGAIADAIVHRLGWLAGQVPKDPRPPTVKPVPYRPNAAELQRFSDAVRASTEPLTVLHDLAIGAVSPVAALALREVFPRFFQQIQDELVEQVSEAPKSMPYPMMTRLSLVFDVPLDNTMAPEYLARRRAEDAVAMQSAQPPASGPKMQTSKQSEFGAIRRAMR